MKTLIVLSLFLATSFVGAQVKSNITCFATSYPSVNDKKPISLPLGDDEYGPGTAVLDYNITVVPDLDPGAAFVSALDNTTGKRSGAVVHVLPEQDGAQNLVMVLTGKLEDKEKQPPTVYIFCQTPPLKK